MSEKALLVMDMPEKCEKCPLCDFGDYTCGAFVMIGENYTYEVPEDGVADWCPLKPVPEKMDCPQMNGENYEAGWNACIDEILGETV